MRRSVLMLCTILVSGGCDVGGGNPFGPVEESTEPTNALPVVGGTQVASNLGLAARFSLSSDGVTMYAVSDEGSRLLNIDLNTRAATLITGIAGSNYVSVPVESADRSTLYYLETNRTTNRSSLRKVVRATQAVTVIAENATTTPVISQSGQLVAFATGDTLKVLKVQDGSITGFSGCMRPVIFSPQGDELLCEKPDQTFASIALATAHWTPRVIKDPVMAHVALNARGPSIFQWTQSGLDILYVESSALRRYDIERGVSTTLVEGVFDNLSYAQSSSGLIAYWTSYCAQYSRPNSVFCAKWQGVLTVVDLTGAKKQVVVTGTYPTLFQPGMLVFSADNRRLYYGNGPTVFVIEL